jgi:hypothetical protein
MKTIIKTINLFKFEELSKEAQQKAIEKEINYRYKDNYDFLNWVIDDCFLLEPEHEEMKKIKGYETLKEPIFNNNRKIYFSLGYDKYIDISEALTITDEDIFFQWLGINNRLRNKITYEIQKNYIEFNESYYTNKPITPREAEKLKEAEEKTKKHFENVLKRIQKDYEYNFTDEAITEHFKENDFYFLEDGEIYKKK